jgi:hypothetical protein
VTGVPAAAAIAAVPDSIAATIPAASDLRNEFDM